MEDTSLKNRMTVMVQANRESSQSLSKLDEEVRSPIIDILLSHPPIDNSTSAITPEFAFEKDIPTVLRRKSCRIHSDMAGIAV